jgi:hypothetical protein
MDFSVDVTLNILCNKMASEAQKYGSPNPEVPVLPNERWALYITHPVSQKVMGHMELAVASCIHQDDCAQYI